MNRNDQAWAVFRCSLLKPLLLDEISAAERGAYFQQLSQQEQLLPNGQRKKISVRTLRRWWQRLRDSGVEKLVRQRRTNRGEPNQRHRDILARAVELKREQPLRSDQVINKILRQEFGRTVSRSTLYRHLRRQGATRLKLGVTEQKVRCRWTRDHSNALWVGDFSQGPVVLHEGRAVKTHLSAWIDCHSRYVVEARYYLQEDLDVLVESLLRAWSNHGASREIYVDNAKIYHSNGLELACARLSIKLLHRPPRDPAPGGLIERFFQTLQGQLGAEVDASSLLTLVELNRLLQAWLAVAYHVTIHSETRQTPAARFAAGKPFLRRVDLHAVRSFFYRYVPRTVDRTHSDVSIDGRTFKVDLNLRGDAVIVKYDPFQSYEELLEVELLSDLGVYLGKGARYERERGGGVAMATSLTSVEQLGLSVCATGFASAAGPKACTLWMDRCSNNQPACIRCCQASLLERHWWSQWHTDEAYWRMANVAVLCRKRRMACRECVEDRQTAALADQASSSGHWTTCHPWPAGRVCAAPGCCGSSPSQPPGPPA